MINDVVLQQNARELVCACAAAAAVTALERCLCWPMAQLEKNHFNQQRVSSAGKCEQCSKSQRGELRVPDACFGGQTWKKHNKSTPTHAVSSGHLDIRKEDGS